MLTIIEMAYSKLHASLVNSSLWCEPDKVRILFITMLAIADRDGCIYGSRSGVFRQANITHDPDGDDPFEILLSPDPDSSDLLRNPDNEGRRIEEIPGGFRLLNYAYYRGLRNDDDRREQNRVAQERYRKTHSATVSQRKPRSAKKSQGQTIPSASASDSSSVSKKKASTEEEVVQYCSSIGLTEEDGKWFWEKCEGCGWKNAGKSIEDWKLTISSWKRVGTIFPSHKQKSPNGQRPMSAFEIERRKEAISEKINKIFKSNGSKRVEGDGIDELKQRRDELQRELTS